VSQLYMKEILNNLKSDKTMLWGFTVSFLFLLLNGFYFFINYSNLPPYLPIYNQMPWGEERLGTKDQLLIPLIIATVIFLTNFLISYLIYIRMPLVSRMLCITTLLICFFTLLFSFRTVQLVT